MFHNGREVDAEAVKLNIERIQDPKIGGDWERGAIENITTAEVIDRYTVRLNTQEPDASVPTAVMHYPTRMIAPDAFDQVSDHPVGTGPFKFVSWTRWNETRLERFENYWETDAEGNSLPVPGCHYRQTQTRGLCPADRLAHRPGRAHQQHGARPMCREL